MSPEPNYDGLPAEVQPSRSWECPGCHGTFRGNGGISSHQRICESYHRTQIRASQNNIDLWEAEGNRGVDIRNARRTIAVHREALALIVDQQVADSEAQLTPAQRVDIDPPAAAEG